jgi:C-terminal processing protease CtpA/Prc
MFLRNGRLWKSTVITLGLLWIPSVNQTLSGNQDEKPKLEPKPATATFQQPQQFGGFQGQQRGQFGFATFLSHARLGVGINKPSETLIEQLDLPRGHALVVESVIPDSPAAKAGIKVHDILLKVQDKPVAGEPVEFSQLLGQLKADTAIDLVVLRKGKEQTIKDVKLPELTASPQPIFQRGRRAASFQPAPPISGAGRMGVVTTLSRSNDQFTASHREGALNISVTGKLEDGKVSVSSIHVQDRNKNNTYDSVDKVPEEYQAKVKSLVELSKAGNIKVEVHTPDKESESKKK